MINLPAALSVVHVILSIKHETYFYLVVAHKTLLKLVLEDSNNVTYYLYSNNNSHNKLYATIKYKPPALYLQEKATNEQSIAAVLKLL